MDQRGDRLLLLRAAVWLPGWGWGGASYYSCGGSFYQPIYEGDTVVYVTVPDPSNGQQAPGPMEPPGEASGPARSSDAQRAI